MRARGLIVDLFAGGGGASTGIFAALGRHPDIAINHSAAAIAMHTANHPTTMHYQEDIWEVDPRKAVGRRKVALLWAPSAVSRACRELVRAGYADVSPFGYRARQVRQLELGAAAPGGGR